MHYIRLSSTLCAVVSKCSIVLIDILKDKYFILNSQTVKMARNWWNETNSSYAHVWLSAANIDIFGRRNGYVHIGINKIENKKMRELYRLWDSLQPAAKRLSNDSKN